MIRDTYKRKRTGKIKIGEIKIKIPHYFGPRFGTQKKPIWAYLEKNYWTDQKTMCVLNINFNEDEAYIALMLYERLRKKYIGDIEVSIQNAKVYISTSPKEGFAKRYYKLFINLDPEKNSIDKVVADIDDTLMRSVTTFKTNISEKKLDRFKLKAVAELL